MRTTTQQPNEDGLPSLSFFGDPSVPTGEPASSTLTASTFSFSSLRAPDADRSLEVHETKALARAIIKKRLKDGEWEALLAERQQLLDKQFSGAMTKSDSNRLDYVRWSLDQIEDAKHGDALDILESSIARYESFLEGVQQLNRDLVRNISTRKR